MAQIFVYIDQHNGIFDDLVLEFLTAARKIDAGASVTAIVAGYGKELAAVCDTVLKAYDRIWMLDREIFAFPNAEVVRKALVNILPSNSIVLIAHDTFGMDLAPGLSIKMDASFASDIVDIEGTEDKVLKMVRQEYGGAVSTHIRCDYSSGSVITIRPGCFPPGEYKGTDGRIIDKSAHATDIEVGRSYLETITADVGDVDITKAEVILSIGRGIGDEDNIDIAHQAAESIGAEVACSRPIVDAKWLEISRQVGISGLTVKPKVYIACGISGSFQHMGGIKGNPFIISINKNPKAPIFQVSDVGIEADILDFLPEFTKQIEALND